MDRDIVYILKNGVGADELRYSLRSVVKNFNFSGKVWFYGGCPAVIRPDRYIKFDQFGITPWDRARSMYLSIFLNNEITPEFWLFNDDFFIMEPYDAEIPWTNGTLYRQADRIIKRNGKKSDYTRRLERAANILRSRSLDVISYETHTPFLVNRKKAFEVLKEFPPEAVFRSTYGNLYEIGGLLREDTKLVWEDDIPDDRPVLSTSDKSFMLHQVGSFIRKAFPEPCKYEKGA